MLKNLWDKTRCALGTHEGEWKTLPGDPCTQEQVCIRCQARSRRTEHTWGDWFYRSDGQCDIERNCTSCAVLEEDVEHSWGVWEYQQDASCIQVQHCQRCAAVRDETQIEHTWGEWSYQEALRAPARDCTRCGTRMTRLPVERIFAGAPSLAATAAPLRASLASPSVTAAPAASRAASLFTLDPNSVILALVKETGDSYARTAQFLKETAPDALKPFILTFSPGEAREKALEVIREHGGSLGLSVLSMLAANEVIAGNLSYGFNVAIHTVALGLASATTPDDPEICFPTGQAMRTVARILENEQRMPLLLGFTQEAQHYLERLDYPERQEELAIQTLFQIRAYLSQGELQRSRELLDAVPLDILEPTYRSTYDALANLWQKVYDVSVTTLPIKDEETQDRDLRLLEQLVRVLDTLTAGAPALSATIPALGAVSREAHNFIDRSEHLTAAEWALSLRELLSRVFEIVDGANLLTEDQRKMMKRDILGLALADESIGRDPAWLQQAIPQMEKDLAWLRQKKLVSEEQTTLWALAICHYRLKEYDPAILLIQELRQSLEALRRQITDPLKRAGVFGSFPALFGVLCSALAHQNRTAELLEAIEGAKGQALADKLTCVRRSVIEEGGGRTQALVVEQLRAQQAHYLTFLVDEPEIFAVLAARDGTLHQQVIPISQKQLADWEKDIAPETWPNTAKNLRARKPLPERLAPLVSWLEPLFDSGLVRQGDHLCYAPDDLLHMYPLHYVQFRGQPLVCSLSVSRIHGAESLQGLLTGSAARPRRYIAVQVPSQEDVTRDPEKVASFGAASRWLVKNMQGTLLKNGKAGWKTLATRDWTKQVVHFSTHGIFPFKNKLQQGQDANPYTGSGLVLASDDQLPALETIFSEASLVNAGDWLLSPAKILGLNFHGSHVSMMACVSGMATEGYGGDALGMDWALLMSGATSLLSSHWNVDASVAARFSQDFYRLWLGEGRSRAAAWRETVMTLMAENSAPQYWAAFSLSGDWR